AANFKVLTGGEALPQNLADELCPIVGEVWNMYGPTETTVWSLVARVQAKQPVTLGQPIANTYLKVVDQFGADVAVGVPGELLIGGDGVTLGYWRRPELNAERFTNIDGVRYYRSGDLVRLRNDGALLYLGRIDNQVKLRGYRIELGEIETRLANRAGIAEAAVVVQEFGEGDQRLVGFYRTRLEAKLSMSELREHLAATLPAFMIPQHFVELERFPLTPNGKVDRKALVAHSATASITTSENVGDEFADAIILALFRQFLKQPQLQANADFFQYGGHSLLAMRMLAEINKQRGCQLALNDLFQAPTAAALSTLLGQRTAPAAAAITIPLRADRKRFRMSLQQRRLWYLEQLEQTGIEYNLPASWRFRGELNADALAQAVDQFCARHDVLRANLVEENDGLFQYIKPVRNDVLQIHEIDGDSEQQRLEAVMALLAERKGYRFDLAADELFQIELYRLGPQDHVLFVLIHHAIFDGWSFDVMLAELAEGYNAARSARAPQLPELPVQYGDFSEWMRARTEQGNDSDLKFWLSHLIGDLPVLDLPCEGVRPDFQMHRGAALEFVIDAPIMARLNEFARQQGVTLYMMMMAIFKVLLWRYSGQRDVIVGTPISGRNYAEINYLIGFFVNILALRDRLDPAAPFAQLLQQIKQTCLDAYAHQDVPFEQLVERLNPPRDSSRSAIFQVMLMYQDISNRTEVFEDLTRQQINIDRPGVQTDLDFWLKWDGKVMAGGFEYDRDVLSRATVEAMRADLVALAQRIPDMATHSLWQLVDLANADLQQTLRQLNATDMPLPAPALMHRLFEEQARRTPAAVATRYRGKRLTYAELETRANRIANWLDAKGIQSGALIGVALTPSDWLQAALLGVLKHGSAYVPIDPQFPVERIRYMIDNSALALLLYDETLDTRLLDGTALSVTRIDTLIDELQQCSADAPVRTIDSEQPAYVIYTSGSTGRPKGVVLKHRGVVNYLLSMTRTPGFGADDCILAATTLSFDIAVTELFLPLITGGSSVLVDRDIATDGDLLREVIETAGITVYQATPSSWRLLLGADWRGDRKFKALCGGEALPAELIKPLLANVGELWNVYGPTETTVWSTLHRVQSIDDVGVIGVPFANTVCYVLDEQRRPVPLGVIGELCIGGAGVAQGYLNRADLTAERFIDNPFGAGKLYRTGDMARLRASGVIEYRGRSDHQVKVRGYRIELGEIESALAQHPALAQAVVVAREFERDDQRLVAYLVAKKGDTLDVAELRRFLRDYLPSYMLPQHIVLLDAMPMTPNLKIDRKALPEPVVEMNTTNECLPSTDNEIRLATIWCEVLKIDRVRPEDNFFDSGGHSLTATDAIRRIYQQTGHRFEVREFIMETLEQLAAKLGEPTAVESAATNLTTAAEKRGLGRFIKRFTGKAGA
ncbi:MAG TPA: amino acid adenylation domain-containing protein, partial [Spongiibacteraceae bacterium]